MAARAAESRDRKISSSYISYGKLPRVYFILHTLREMSCNYSCQSGQLQVYALQ